MDQETPTPAENNKPSTIPDATTQSDESAASPTVLSATRATIDEIREILLEKIDNDSIHIPTLPEIATSVRQVCGNDNATVKDVCDVIEKDPGIAARVIKVANSPLFRGSKAIETLNMATARLGLRYTANYVTGIAMQQLYKPKDPTIEKFMRNVWEQSSMIAASAMLVARLESHFSPEQATLAGLTHQIGMLPLLLHAEEDEILRKDPALLSLVMKKIHGELGSMILYQWDFPPEIADVPVLYNKPDRESPEACYGDVISIAYAQCINAGKLSVDWLQPNQVTAAHQRMSIPEPVGEEEKKSLVEHIEMTAEAFAA